MESVGVRVCRETKQVSYRISCWFNFSAVVGNSLICISEGKEQSLKEGLEAGIGKEGLVPPSQDTWAVFQLLLQSRGVQGGGSDPAANTGANPCVLSCPSQSKGFPALLVPKDPRGTGLGVGFGALTPCGNAAGLLMEYQLPQ